MRAKPYGDKEGKTLGYRFYCPGCQIHHGLNTLAKTAEESAWTTNGNAELPTFRPSVLVKGGWSQTATQQEIDDCDAEWDDKAICHSYVTDGRIQYLSDTTHKYSGQTIDLPEIEQQS